MTLCLHFPSFLSYFFSLYFHFIMKSSEVRGIGKCSTDASMEAPITPSVNVDYTQLLINGQFTGDVIAHAAEGDAEDVNRAVSAAPKAFDEGPWPKMTAYERSRVLFRFADLNGKHSDEIAPFEQAAEIEAKMLFFRYHAACGNTIFLCTFFNVAATNSSNSGWAASVPLGGRSQIIVCEDADASKKKFDSKRQSNTFGQCCCAGSRTFVHEKVYDEFIEKAKAHAERRVVGDPSKGGVEQGPQTIKHVAVQSCSTASHAFPVLYSNHTDSDQFEKIPKYVDYGVKGGAKMEAEERGLAHRVSILSPLYFQMDLNEVIRRENNSHYGLAAGMSGIGREKGIYGLSNYLQVKAVVTAKNKLRVLHQNMWL
ncbi:unnamed protein product [Malus baccata var. baccata]